jgi:hypothetical protein
MGTSHDDDDLTGFRVRTSSQKSNASCSFFSPLTSTASYAPGLQWDNASA